MATFVKKEGNQVTFTFEIESAAFEDGIKKAYAKSKNRFNIPGFRKGKAPMHLIEKMYGAEIFYEDAVNLLLPEAYDASVEALDLYPVDRPVIDIDTIERGQNILVTAEVTVKPEVALGEYKGVQAEKIEALVTEEEIQAEIDRLAEQNARMIEISERAVKEGDLLTIDYKGFTGDVQFPGGTAENQTLEIGSGTFIPGFEEQLVGKNIGDEVEVNVTFPTEYHSDELAGKEAVFKVKIHEIKEKELPALDDEFAKDVSEFDTLAELKADIESKMKKAAEKKALNQTRNNVIDKVVETATVEIPEAMIDAQIESEMKNFQYSLMYQGLTLEKYFEITGTTVEDLKEQIRPNAERLVRNDLVLEAISEKEAITLSDAETEEEINKLAEQYGQAVEEFKKNLRDGDLDYIKAGAIKVKTIDFLVENAK